MRTSTPLNYTSAVFLGMTLLGGCGESDAQKDEGARKGDGGNASTDDGDGGGRSDEGVGGQGSTSSGSSTAFGGDSGGSQGNDSGSGGQSDPGAGGNSGSSSMGGVVGSGGQGSGGMQASACDNSSPALVVELLADKKVELLGRPFDTDLNDLEGPLDWAPQYGKSPEIIAFSTDDALDVLFQDQDSDESAYLVHIVATGESFEVNQAYRIDSLGRVMGMTRDTEGNYYVATGVDEDSVVDAIYPPNEIHRPDIVRIVKFDESGCVLMESDVDMERKKADPDSEIIVNPMVAASSRLVWGGDRLLLVHGHNTEPDAALDGTRHQKAISTQLNALDGSVTRTETMWVSHSFDQRALYDGSGFVELHLGDAYPRTVALGHYHDTGGDGAYEVYAIKGETGANNTFSRLGGLVQSSDPTYGYMALFATERSTAIAGDDVVQGTRDIALVRIKSDFMNSRTDSSVVEEGGSTSTQQVLSAGENVTNNIHWLTDFGDDMHAERPRITQIGDDDYLVLFEQWSTASGQRNTFEGTFALRVDSSGAVLAGPTEIVGEHHLSRGDDIVSFGGQAVYVTGGEGALYLNLVASDLSSERIALP